MQKKKIGQQKKNETEVKGERQRRGKTVGKGQKEEEKIRTILGEKYKT